MTAGGWVGLGVGWWPDLHGTFGAVRSLSAPRSSGPACGGKGARRRQPGAGVFCRREATERWW